MLYEALPDVLEKGSLVNAPVAGIERHQLGDVFETGAQVM